jgi:hypothetical protein
VNYGQSRLSQADGEVNPTLVEKNDEWTVGVYHNLTNNLTLTAELSYVQSLNQSGQKNESKKRRYRSISQVLRGCVREPTGATLAALSKRLLGGTA